MNKQALMTRTTTSGNTHRAFGNSFPSTALESPRRYLSSSEAFIRALRNAVTGVNIVTTDGPAGRFGLTVSAFSSVSAEPPLILVCINTRSPACGAIHDNETFCVNVLSTGQRDLADRFSGRPRDGRPYDFGAGVWYRARTGAPVLTGTAANIDCELETAITAGTHQIFIGRALVAVDGTGQPLLYTNRAYGRPSHEQAVEKESLVDAMQDPLSI